MAGNNPARRFTPGIPASQWAPIDFGALNANINQTINQAEKAASTPIPTPVPGASSTQNPVATPTAATNPAAVMPSTPGNNPVRDTAQDIAYLSAGRVGDNGALGPTGMQYLTPSAYKGSMFDRPLPFMGSKPAPVNVAATPPQPPPPPGAKGAWPPPTTVGPSQPPPSPRVTGAWPPPASTEGASLRRPPSQPSTGGVSSRRPPAPIAPVSVPPATPVPSIIVNGNRYPIGWPNTPAAPAAPAAPATPTPVPGPVVTNRFPAGWPNTPARTSPTLPPPLPATPPQPPPPPPATTTVGPPQPPPPPPATTTVGPPQPPPPPGAKGTWPPPATTTVGPPQPPPPPPANPARVPPPPPPANPAPVPGAVNLKTGVPATAADDVAKAADGLLMRGAKAVGRMGWNGAKALGNSAARGVAKAAAPVLKVAPVIGQVAASGGLIYDAATGAGSGSDFDEERQLTRNTINDAFNAVGVRDNWATDLAGYGVHAAGETMNSVLMGFPQALGSSLGMLTEDALKGNFSSIGSYLKPFTEDTVVETGVDAYNYLTGDKAPPPQTEAEKAVAERVAQNQAGAGNTGNPAASVDPFEAIAQRLEKIPVELRPMVQSQLERIVDVPGTPMRYNTANPVFANDPDGNGRFNSFTDGGYGRIREQPGIRETTMDTLNRQLAFYDQRNAQAAERQANRLRNLNNLRQDRAFDKREEDLRKLYRSPEAAGNLARQLMNLDELRQRTVADRNRDFTDQRGQNMNYQSQRESDAASMQRQNASDAAAASRSANEIAARQVEAQNRAIIDSQQFAAEQQQQQLENTRAAGTGIDEYIDRTYGKDSGMGRFVQEYIQQAPEEIRNMLYNGNEEQRRTALGDLDAAYRMQSEMGDPTRYDPIAFNRAASWQDITQGFGDGFGGVDPFSMMWAKGKDLLGLDGQVSVTDSGQVTRTQNLGNDLRTLRTIDAQIADKPRRDLLRMLNTGSAEERAAAKQLLEERYPGAY